MKNSFLKFILVGACLLIISVGCHTKPLKVAETKIAFGSCAHEDAPQPMLRIAASLRPSVFIYLGDNIYGDTDNMDTLQAKYDKLAAKPEYKQLVNSTKVLAIWDDHDFGRNDAGKYYPFAKQSKEIFLTFFKEPLKSERRQHSGIYHVEYLEQEGKKIQIILLDNRTFRSNLLRYDGQHPKPQKSYFYTPDYSPHTSADSALLGEEQWSWLEKQLLKPADLRLICSGSQFGIEFNGYEAWANFPHEQRRMLNLIKSTRAEEVLFLTGDVHYAEISKIQEDGMYPLYDITASGITSTWEFATPNANRIEGPVMENHIGLLTVRWEKDPLIRMEIIDKFENYRISYDVRASALRFK